MQIKKKKISNNKLTLIIKLIFFYLYLKNLVLLIIYYIFLYIRFFHVCLYLQTYIYTYICFFKNVPTPAQLGIQEMARKWRHMARVCAKPVPPPNDTWALLAPMLATAIRAICGQGRVIMGVTHDDPITRSHGCRPYL